MARPNKQGLDYFPLDVDFFNDEKIEAISGEFGIKGEIVTIKLLSAIYRNGYFIVWSEMLKMKLLKNLNGVSKELLEQIVLRLVKWNFFNESLFNSEKVLTSKGIQTRYLEATKRRKNNDFTHYWLLNEVNVNINPQGKKVNVNINSQSKVNKSKVNDVVVNSDNNDNASFKNSVLSDVGYLEISAMQTKSNIETIKHYLQIFENHLVQIGESKKTLKDFKYHFTQWLNKQHIKIIKPKKKIRYA